MSVAYVHNWPGNKMARTYVGVNYCDSDSTVPVLDLTVNIYTECIEFKRVLARQPHYQTTNNSVAIINLRYQK